MKKTGILFGMLALAGNALAQSGFTLTSRIGGLRDGDLVVLKESESGLEKVIAQDTVHDGRFVLEGRVESPTLCELRIQVPRVSTNPEDNGERYTGETEIKLMVENLPITVEAAHTDSIPLGWEYRRAAEEKEANVRITAGRAQREFQELRDAVRPIELQSWRYRMKAYSFPEEMRDSIKFYSLKDREWGEKAEQAQFRFMAEHSDYSISIFLLQKEVLEPFTFSDAALDSMVVCASTTYDKVRLARLKRNVEELKHFKIGMDYIDIPILTTENQVKRLKEFVKPGVYTIIDFWASWCGPCRRSIPHVKELAAKYGDKLEIFSISTDSDDKSWRRALDQEKMTWTQMRVPEDKREEVFNAYRLRGIPYIFLLSPEKKVLCVTYSPDEVSKVLDKNLSL